MSGMERVPGETTESDAEAIVGGIEEATEAPGAPSEVPCVDLLPCLGAEFRGDLREEPEEGDPQLTTGDLARACQTTVRTVRFYEEAGLLRPSSRSNGGHRLFCEEARAKLQLIADMREAGLSLGEIKTLFQIKEAHDSAAGASQEMARTLQGHVDALQKKILVLRRLRDELSSMVTAISECSRCDATRFPEKCRGCEVMEQSELPRAMRLLWGEPPSE